MEELAVYGGAPLRTKPFPTKWLGAAMIGDEELNELGDVVAEKTPFRHYGIGVPRKTDDFEREAREFLGAKFFLGLSSGSAALYCAAVALGIGMGDEVILPAFGWYSDFYSIAASGALPVLADIDESLNLDPEDFKRKITDRTKAVIVIHYQGGPARLDEIMKIARERNVKVIEDCAQAFGGEYRGKFLGTHGDVGVVSFQNAKMITCGEGGALYTDNEEYFIRAVRYHDLGFVRDAFKNQIVNKALAAEEESFIGSQFRMGELSGAFLLAQIRKLPYILERCRKGHRAVREYFRDNKRFSFRFIDEGDCGITLFLKFPSANEAKSFSEALSMEGIPIGPSSGCDNLTENYPIKSRRMLSDNLPPFGKGFAGESVKYNLESDCPNTNGILARHVAVAIGPSYTDEDVADIIRGIEKVDRGLRV